MHKGNWLIALIAVKLSALKRYAEVSLTLRDNARHSQLIMTAY